MIFTKEAHQSAKFQWLQVKFYQICTLIGSFCWKYLKFQLKKYRGVMSHDTEEWCKIWRKTNLLFQKWQEFGEFWSKHSKVSKIFTLIGPFRARYVKFALKKYRGVIFMTMKSHARFEEKLTCGLKNDTRNLANFYQNTWKCQNWYFHGILLLKAENAWAKNLQRS